MQAFRYRNAFIAAMLLFLCNASAAPIRVAIITGDHPYDQEVFPQLWQGNEDIEPVYIALKDKGELFDDVSQWDYDVMVLYNMSNPMHKDPAQAQIRYENFVGLLERGVGLVPMHHGILSYMDWPEGRDIYGCTIAVDGPYGFHLDQEHSVHIEDPNHPITLGMSDFLVHDETYTNYYQRPREGNHVILTTQHTPSDPVLGWVRTYKNSRVCCIQMGHDARVFLNKDYKHLMAQAIRWASGRLPDKVGGDSLDNTTRFRVYDTAFIKEALVHYEFGKSRTALDMLHAQCMQTLKDNTGRDEKAQALMGFIQSDISPDSKRFLLRELVLLRSEAVIPQLIELLNTPDWCDPALYALKSIGGTNVVKALLPAVGNLQGASRIGVINLLGLLRDPAAIPPLASLLESPDKLVVSAIVDAFGAIGGEGASQALDNAAIPKELAVQVGNAQIRCAEALLAEGKAQAALDLYNRFAKEEQPKAIRTAAIAGILLAGKDNALLIQTLSQPDTDFQNAALSKTATLANAQTTSGVASLLQTSTPALKVQLIHALADSGEKSALDALIGSLRDADENVRLAALERIGELGDESSVDSLVTAVIAGNEQVKGLAREALASLDGKSVDARLADMLSSNEAPRCCVAITALADRHAASSYEPISELTLHSDSSVRLAALEALGRLANPDNFPALLARLASVQADDLQAAEQAGKIACGRMRDKNTAFAHLAAAYQEAPALTQTMLIRLAGQLPGDPSLAFLTQHVDDSDLSIREAALTALGLWPHAQPLEVLLRVAHDTTLETHRTIALEGCVALLDKAKDLTDQQRLKALSEVLLLSKMESQKKIVVEELAKIPTIESLRAVMPLTGKPGEAQLSAILSALELCKQLGVECAEESNKALQSIAATSPDKDYAQAATKASEALSQLAQRLKCQWSFNAGAEGWVASNQCTIEANNGVLQIQSTGKDPFITAPCTAPKGDLVIQFRAKFDINGVGQVFWINQANAPFGDGDHVATFELYSNDGRWHEYEIPLSIDAELSALRFDPGFDKGSAQFDWIRILLRKNDQ